MSGVKAWEIAGAEGGTIFGETHEASGHARGVAVIAHGFKGYKNYGMIPVIARELAKRGFIAHRFNFSHSGMTNRIEMFERPDLFEKDTWNTQVEDVVAVVEAMRSGEIEGGGLPVVLAGHSRGGVAVLLTMGRHGAQLGEVKGVVSISAPDSCMGLGEAEMREIRERGWAETVSSRTGQKLRIGRAWIEEQMAQPEAHDLEAMVKRIECRVLAIHGEADPTVDAQCAERIARWAKTGSANIVMGADHVFNTPNPFPENGAIGRELGEVIEEMAEFAGKCCAK